MNLGDQQRIGRQHLDRNAVVYLRQSDPRQVREHVESTALQRGLRERAIEMGWPNPKLVEDDLGISAGGFADRPGFQWLLAQVTLRKIGIIFCMEASRLSRWNVPVLALETERVSPAPEGLRTRLEAFRDQIKK